MAQIKPVWVSTKEAKMISGLSERTLRNLKEQEIIGYREQGQRLFYNHDDILLYLSATSHRSDPKKISSLIREKEVAPSKGTKPKFKGRSKEMPTWNQSYNQDGTPKDGHFWIKFSNNLTLKERPSERNGTPIFWVDFRVREKNIRRTPTVSTLIDLPINTKEEAWEVMPLVQFKLHQEASEPVKANGKMRFKAFAPIYLDAKKADRERSFRSLEIAVKNQLVPYFGDKALDEFTEDDVKGYLYFRRGQGSTDGSTWMNELSPLKEIFKMAIEKGHIVHNPVSRKKLKIKIKNRERYMMPSEEKIIWPILKKHAPLDDMADFIYDNAMRPTNICDLQWPWIHYEERLAIVPAEFHKQKTVGEYSLSDKIIALLKRREEEAAEFDDDFPYVFWRVEEGQRYKITTRWIQDHWSQVCKEAGVEDLHFYDLKHSCLSNLASMGLTQFQLQSISNHLSVASLARYVKPKMMRSNGQSQEFLNQRNEAYGRSVEAE